MAKQRKWAVADCETIPFKKGRPIPGAYVWEFWDGETRFVTYDTQEFVDYIKDFDGILYAHNGGKFDWHFILEYLEPYENIMLINGRIAKAPLGKCELRDSYNIIPVPLSAYKKDDFDYSLLEEANRKKPGVAKKILKYLHSDCVNLYELITRFIDDYGICLTFAGAAMKTWVKMSDQGAPASDASFYEYVAPFYYGGRVECFESGIIEGDFKSYDINSAYSAAMLQNHPYSTNYIEHAGYEPGCDFYEVVGVSHGAFPFRTGSSLVFPHDDVVRTYTVTGWEYQAAIDTNTFYEQEVLRSLKFVDHRNFEQYVTHFGDMRASCKAAGDKAGDVIAKFMGNSLYGKFAANPENYSNHMIIPLDVAGGLDGTGWEFAGDFGPWGLAEKPLEEERRRYYNVATGASITGFVRAQLWRGICCSRRVLYCDTDNIKCEEAGADVIIGDALGEWKMEGRYDRAGIGGKKLYIMRGYAGWWKDANGKTIQAKAKPPGATRLYSVAHKGAKLTHSQLWRVAGGGHVTYESEAPTFSAKKAQSFVKRKIRKTT